MKTFLLHLFEDYGCTTEIPCLPSSVTGMTKPTRIQLTEELIAKAQAGDPKARNELCIWTRAYVRAHARTPTPASNTPSDLSQDVVERVLKKLADFNGGPAEYKSWVRKILLNRERECKRDATREIRDVRKDDSFEENFPEGLPAEQPTPSEFVANDENIGIIFGILFHKTKFSPLYREVLIWRLFYKEPLAVVARKMQKSESAVESLFRRALVKLSEKFVEDTHQNIQKTPLEVYKRRAYVLLEYMRRCDAGENVNIAAFVAEFPDEDSELRSMLEWIAELRTVNMGVENDNDDKDDKDEET